MNGQKMQQPLLISNLLEHAERHHGEQQVVSRRVEGDSTRSEIGSDSTHCSTGTCGMTWSTRWAAVCDIRRAPHERQNPRRLQLKANSLPWPHSPQRSLKKLWARMPHSRKASNSSLMKRGSSDPVLASVWAMKHGRMLLHQAVQGGLLRAMPLVVQRGAVRRPLGRSADGLHTRLPRW